VPHLSVIVDPSLVGYIYLLTIFSFFSSLAHYWFVLRRRWHPWTTEPPFTSLPFLSYRPANSKVCFRLFSFYCTMFCYLARRLFLVHIFAPSLSPCRGGSYFFMLCYPFPWSSEPVVKGNFFLLDGSLLSLLCSPVFSLAFPFFWGSGYLVYFSHFPTDSFQCARALATCVLFRKRFHPHYIFKTFAGVP